MADASENDPVNVYVQYIQATPTSYADIKYFKDAALTDPFKVADSITHGTNTQFTFFKANDTDGFTFDAVVFYPQDTSGIISNVVQSFRETVDGTALFEGICFVDNINLTPSEDFLTFRVKNNNTTVADGVVGVHVTILTEESEKFLTSSDPKIPLPPST